MRTEHIQYILAIRKAGSISAAAEELFVGQTTLSSVVRRVEEEVGFPIFRRTHAGVTVTPEGEAALAIMEQMDARLRKIDRLKNHPAVPSSIPLLISSTLNYNMSLPLSLRLMETEPAESLEFRVCTGSEIVPRIINNESRLGITSLANDEMEKYRPMAGRYDIHAEILFYDHLYLLARADSALAGRDTIHAEELKDLDMDLAMMAHFSIGKNALAHTQQLGRARRYTTYPNLHLVKHAILSQNAGTITSGFAVFHDDAFPREAFHALRLVMPAGDPDFQTCLIHRGTDSMTTVENHVLDLIRRRWGGLLPG